MLKKISTTVHLISVRLSSLLFLRGALFFFLLILFISRLTREERAKATSRNEIENCAVEPKTMKISSSQLRRSSLDEIVAHETSPDYGV